MKLDGDKLLAALDQAEINANILAMNASNDSDRVTYITAIASIENIQYIVALIKSGDYTVDLGA